MGVMEGRAPRASLPMGSTMSRAVTFCVLGRDIMSTGERQMGGPGTKPFAWP